MKTTGVLALQGDFRKHTETLMRLGAPFIEIRGPSELNNIGALIIPGGESTTIGKLMVRFGLLEPLRDFITGGLPVFGTCAGMILLAAEITGVDQPKLGCLDITVARNAYGRQIDSFEADVTTSIPACPVVKGVFIRAPQAVRTGPSVEVLGHYENNPVILKQDNILAASFHPELTDDTRVHEYFLQHVG